VKQKYYEGVYISHHKARL